MLKITMTKPLYLNGELFGHARLDDDGKRLFRFAGSSDDDPYWFDPTTAINNKDNLSGSTRLKAIKIERAFIEMEG